MFYFNDFKKKNKKLIILLQLISQTCSETFIHIKFFFSFNNH